MEVEAEPTETPTVVVPGAGADMVASLEQATLIAKQLPSTTDPSHLLQILTALHSAHHHLSLFLSHHPPPLPENSTSSAVGEENDEPMLMGDDEDEVVWRMKECFIQNKRPKRQLSPSSAMTAELRRAYENEAERDGPAMVPTAEFDPLGTKLRSIGPGMFEGEALGLNAMYETQTIRVPKPFKVGSLPTGRSYIIMEFIEFGASRGNQAELGRKLAEMHKAGKSSKGFGFDVDNTIRSTPQINTWMSDWIEFYGVHRLGYQLKLARQQYGDSLIYEKGQRLVKNMARLFDGAVIEPCLLHGDLWSGNISSDKNGEPVILDPACYYGHNEAEFGMSWCAGFGGSFYSAYFEVMPKQPGFEKRMDLYMLYHYLNHYNLFGSGYRSSSMSITDDYLRMLNA